MCAWFPSPTFLVLHEKMRIFRRVKREDFIIVAVRAHLSMTVEANSLVVPLIERHEPAYWELWNPEGYMIGFRSKLDSSHARADALVRSIQDLIDSNPAFEAFTLGRSEGPVIVEFDWRGRVTARPLGGTVIEAMRNAERHNGHD